MVSQTSLMNLIIANVVYHMDRLGITAAELNRRAGLNQTGAYDILKGKIASPRLDTLEKMAAALGVTVPQLMKRPEEDALTEEIVREISALTPEDRARFLAMARAYLASGTS